MSVFESLDKIENLVVGARHVPFTEKTMVNDGDLIHYVGELRHDISTELEESTAIGVSTGYILCS